MGTACRAPTAWSRRNVSSEPPRPVGVILTQGGIASAGVLPAGHRRMKRTLLASATILFLLAMAGPAAAQQRSQVLAQRIRDDEVKLRAEKDPVERQRLAEGIEVAKHELGPYDPSGARVRCQAMWHDAAIEMLEADLKRLGLRSKTTGSAAPAMDARLALRQMALICVTRAWAWGGYLPKYQFDAIGQYLTNNLPILDSLFDDVAATLAKEDAPTAAGPEKDAFLKSCGEIKAGITRMKQATEAFKTADAKTPKTREAMMATLPEFVDGLRTVYEAQTAVHDAERQKRAAAGASGAATAARPPAAGATPAQPAVADAAATDATGPTAEEKAAVEKTRALLATLEGDDWKSIRDTMEKYLPMAEQGLQVPAARANAQELLDHLAKTADYIKSLQASKSVFPEYIRDRQKNLVTAFEYLADRKTRQQAYSSLRRLYDGAGPRRILDASPLAPEACQGLLRATTLSGAVFAGMTGGGDSRDQMQMSLATTFSVLAQMKDWPPKDMTGQLLPLYKRSAETFLQAAEAVGRTPLDNPETLVKLATECGTFARDTERVIWADQAIKAVAQYAPTRAAPMYTDFVKTAESLLGDTSAAKMQERSRLNQLFQPFRELADLRLPDAEHAKDVTAISGGTYRGALAIFGRQLTQGVTDATRGNPDALASALEPRYVFRLLRHRAVADAAGLARAGVTNLESFSLPDKPWAQFNAATEEQVRRLLGTYSKPAGAARPMRSFWVWDTVFSWVAAAQQETLKARHPGQSEMERLLRNLGQAADPTPPDSAWFGWAVGYHAANGICALSAGYEGTAQWHHNELRYIRQQLGYDKEFTPAVFDPAK